MFIELIQETLRSRFVSIKTLQRLISRCISLVFLAILADRLFFREMSAAEMSANGMRMLKPISIQGALRDENAHWLLPGR